MADKTFLKRAEPIPEEQQLQRNIHGPLKPEAGNVAKHGPHNILCYSCKAVLVQGVSEAAFPDFTGIQCYNCGEWNTGKPEFAEAPTK